MSFILLAMVVIIVAAVVKTRNDLSVANVISTIGSMWTVGEETDEYEYERSGDVARLSGGLATVSERGVRTYDREGNEALISSFTMDVPRMVSNGDKAIAYDIGSNILKVFTIENVEQEIETEQPIISANINSSGWIALCTQETGYTSSVTVYNTKGTAVYKWSSGEDYILSAAVTDGNKELTALTIGADGSDLVRFMLSGEEETQRFHAEGQVILDFADMLSGDTALVTDSGLIFLDKNGERSAEYDFGGRVLSHYEIGDRAVLLVLYSDSMQSQQEIIAVKADGTEAGKITAHDKVVDISSVKKEYAVLTESGAVVYNEKFEEQAVYDAAEGEKIIALGNGEIMAAGEYMAKIFR